MPREEGEFALLHVERDILKREPALGIFLRDVAEFDHRIRRRDETLLRGARLDDGGGSVKAILREAGRERDGLDHRARIGRVAARFQQSADDFRAAYNSFDVDKKTRRAISLTRRYGIGGVPAPPAGPACSPGLAAACAEPLTIATQAAAVINSFLINTGSLV